MSAAVAQPNLLQMLLGPSRSKQSAPPKRHRAPRGPVETALDSHYSIINRVGSGSTGVVYQAVDRSSNHLLAVKVIARSDLRTKLETLSVRREIHALQALSHPNVLRCRHVRTEGNYLFLATEYCPNGDLFSRMERTSIPLPEREALSIMRDVLRALGHMHSRGFAHRDVKLENILLAADNSVRLADFGLAYYRAPGDERSATAHTTMTTRQCGSPHYVAPEICRGGGYVPAQADVWAAGVTLYALLTRSMPFDAESPRQLCARIVAADPVALTRGSALADVSTPTRRLLRCMLAVKPAERPTAVEAAAYCSEIINVLGR